MARKTNSLCYPNRSRHLLGRYQQIKIDSHPWAAQNCHGYSTANDVLDSRLIKCGNDFLKFIQ